MDMSATVRLSGKEKQVRVIVGRERRKKRHLMPLTGQAKGGALAGYVFFRGYMPTLAARSSQGPLPPLGSLGSVQLW